MSTVRTFDNVVMDRNSSITFGRKIEDSNTKSSKKDRERTEKHRRAKGSKRNTHTTSTNIFSGLTMDNCSIVVVGDLTQTGNQLEVSHKKKKAKKVMRNSNSDNSLNINYSAFNNMVLDNSSIVIGK